MEKVYKAITPDMDRLIKKHAQFLWEDMQSDSDYDLSPEDQENEIRNLYITGGLPEEFIRMGANE